MLYFLPSKENKCLHFPTPSNNKKTPAQFEREFLFIRLFRFLVEPLHIVEVLTVRECRIFRVHTHAAAESTGIVGRYLTLEGVEVAFVTCHLERINGVDLTV